MAFFVSMGQLVAQVQPPQFVCVKNDTLIWIPTGNACGPFNSYDIYAGPTANGPFSLLTSITNQLQTSYYNPVPFGGTLFYFLRSNHNCSGQVALNSDTLDNLLPLSPNISAVSVANSTAVQLNWQPSPSSEVIGYIVYKQTNIGLVPLDTVFGIQNFIDYNAAPDSASEYYTVVALDACGNAGLFGDNHRTIFLEGKINACKQVFELSWNAYQNWPDSVGAQVIWASINNGPWTPLDTVAANATQADLPMLADGLFYCIRIEAKETNKNVPANSNAVCLVSDVVEPVEHLTLQYISKNYGNLSEWYWTLNGNAAVDATEMQRFNTETGQWQQAFAVTLEPLLSSDNYVTANITTDDEIVAKYRVRTIDGCGATFTSNETSSILLKGFPSSSTANVIYWTNYSNTVGACKQYTVYRILDNVTTKIATLPCDSLEYTDVVDASQPGFYNACYYIVADADVTQYNGDILDVQQRCNTVCIEQISRILAPNAFAPRGINQFFKPLLLYPELIAEYELQIFNRWGQSVFETRDPSAAWDGKTGGNDAPAGIYSFYIRLVQKDGRVADLRSTLTLIR